MFERFTRQARAVVTAAEAQARVTGSATIDAEHLLLALAEGDGPVAEALADAGLDPAGLAAALADGEADSLAAVGVDVADWAAVGVRTLPARPRVGASGKLALERSLRAAVARGDRRIGAEHVLLGVLAAEHGRVPRALSQAGIDRAALREVV